MSNLVKGRGQRLIPEYLLKYLENQKKNGVNITQLVDSNGNPRFVEGEGTPATIEGLTNVQCKWSLSGTHLMLVFSANVENTSVIPNANIVTYKLPQYILDNINPVWADIYIESKSIRMVASNFTEQSFTGILTKVGTDIRIVSANAVTLTANRSFRVQFDLLIPSE